MDDLFFHIVPVNEGYDYIFSDIVYIPVYDTSLLVTKRIIMPISLVEEKILQLIEVGVVQIDEMARILGVTRNLLDVTLADLYSRDLVAVTSDSCRMMLAGKEALNNLNRTEKKQDILKNVCIDGVLGNVLDTSECELLKVQRFDDNKLKPQIPIGDIGCYKERFKEISKIFQEQNVLYFLEGVQPDKEELLRIDKIESVFVKFIKISIHVYVSSNGMDIDVIEAYQRQNELLKQYKDYIIEQINHKKIFKNHFKSRKIPNREYRGKKYLEKDGLYGELKKIHFSSNKKDMDYELIANKILSNRKLMDGEYRDILRYISNGQDSVELYVEKLDDWAFDSDFTGSLTEILGKTKLFIFYKESYNPEKSQDMLRRSYKDIAECTERDSGYYFCWKIGVFLIYGIPNPKKVITEGTTCLYLQYYLEKLSGADTVNAVDL